MLNFTENIPSTHHMITSKPTGLEAGQTRSQFRNRLRRIRRKKKHSSPFGVFPPKPNYAIMVIQL